MHLNRLIHLGILVLLCVKGYKKINSESFDVQIINFAYSVQEHLLEIVICPLIMLIDYPQSLTNADILGQENLNLVSEKSGKSQGILLSIIFGNPVEAKVIILTYYVQSSVYK